MTCTRPGEVSPGETVGGQEYLSHRVGVRIRCDKAGNTPTLQLLSLLYTRGDLHTQPGAYKHSLANQKGLDHVRATGLDGRELLSQVRSHPGSCFWLLMFIREEGKGRPLRKCWLARGGGMALRALGQVGCQARLAPHQRPPQSASARAVPRPLLLATEGRSYKCSRWDRGGLDEDASRALLWQTDPGTHPRI